MLATSLTSSRHSHSRPQGAAASEASGEVLEPSLEGKPLLSPLREGGGGINTLTGSVRVAASQSNTVTPDVNLGYTICSGTLEAGVGHQTSEDSLKMASPEVYDASQKNKTSSQDDASLEAKASQVETATDAQELLNAHAHPISHPEE